MATEQKSNALSVLNPDKLQDIVKVSTAAATNNRASYDRCLQAGKKLLEKINANGMTDELDHEAEQYIEKSKKTVKKMNESRSPVTKIFDQIRGAFAAFEKSVNPGEEGTIPCQVQQLRNQYAAKKREEQKKKAAEEAKKRARTTAIEKYTLAVDEDYREQLRSHIDEKINQINDKLSHTTLAGYNDDYTEIKTIGGSNLNDSGWLRDLTVKNAQRPPELTEEECLAIEAQVISKNSASYAEQYQFEVKSQADSVLDMMPSKKRELERMSKSSAEEAARIKKDIEEKEKQERERQEAERRQREATEKASKELESKKLEMDGLFNKALLGEAEYQPKTIIKKKVEVTTADGVMQLISFWWSHVGAGMRVDELLKIFSRQVTYANKMANDKTNPTEIKSEFVKYVEDITAK